MWGSKMGDKLRKIKGYIKETRPPVMVMAALAALFGCSMAPSFDLGLALLYISAVFFILYSAHLRDTFVDYFVRKEYEKGYESRLGDSGGVLNSDELAMGFGVGIGVALCIGLYLAWTVSWLLLPIGLIGLFFAIAYPGYLDTHWWEILIWPLGVACAFWGGYVVQTGTLALQPLILGAIVWFILIFAKIIDSHPDMEVDRKIGKETVPTLIGKERSKRLSYAGMYVGVGWGLLFSFFGVIPKELLPCFAIIAPFLAYSQKHDPREGIMIIILGVLLMTILGIGLMLW